MPAATDLVAPLQGGGPDQLAEVFARVLGLTEGERGVVAQVVTAAAELIGSGEGAIDAELGRFARTAVELDEHYPGDPGVLAALLMNRMGFGRFQGLFLPAGNLHAYLHGHRRGDHGQLRQRDARWPHSRSTSTCPSCWPSWTSPRGCRSWSTWSRSRPESGAIARPAPEFALWRVDADAVPVTVPAADSGRIVLVIEGPVEVSDGSTSLTLVRGESVFGYPGDALTVTGTGGTGTVMVAAPGI